MSCAPTSLNSSSRSISSATLTPSWVMVGALYFLPSATLRPLGPKVERTARAMTSTPSDSSWRASSASTICLGMASSWARGAGCLRLFEDRRGTFAAAENPISVNFRGGSPRDQCPVSAGWSTEARLRRPIVVQWPGSERHAAEEDPCGSSLPVVNTAERRPWPRALANGRRRRSAASREAMTTSRARRRRI